jgi:hypothetical protein
VISTVKKAIFTGVPITWRAEARREDLDEDQRGQADAVAKQREAGLHDVGDGEPAVLIQRRHEWQREDRERHGRRQREQHGEAQPPIQQRRILLAVRVAVMLRKRRQQDRAECHAEQRARKLHQAVGIRDPRDAAVAEQRRQLRIDQRRDLRSRHADHRGPHREQHAAHAFAAPIEAGLGQHADRQQRTNLQEQLREAADRHTPREREDRRIHEAREKDRRTDHRQVQQHRRERGNGEPPEHVQHAASERDQRHEQDVREDDADHLGRQLDLAGRARESAGQRVDQPRRRERPRDGQHDQHDGEQRADVADECARRLEAAPAPVFSEDGHERLRERAFGEEATQQVRKPEGGLERVHLQPRTEGGCLDRFAQETGDARQQRHPADCREGTEEIQVGMLRNALPGMQKSRIMPGLSTPLHRFHARPSTTASQPR